MMTPDHFQEQQKSDPAPQLLLLTGAFVMGALAASSRSSLAFETVWIVLAALFVLVAALIRTLTIQVNSQEMRFGFGPFLNKIRLADITSVRIVDSATALPEMPLTVGVRRTADQMSAWIARTGPLVEIKLVRQREMSRPAGYLVSTGRPGDLVAALQPGETSRAAERS